jgi:hypothetical protein
MTSPSDRFAHGEIVWEAFAWIGNDQRPYHRIRRATFERLRPGYELLHYDDGRVDHHWPTTHNRLFRHHYEAVGHCVAVFAGIRDQIAEAIDAVLASADESGGPARAEASGSQEH